MTQISNCITPIPNVPQVGMVSKRNKIAHVEVKDFENSFHSFNGEVNTRRKSCQQLNNNFGFSKKRRKCKVQCIVVNPPTQNHNATPSDTCIRSPNMDLVIKSGSSKKVSHPWPSVHVLDSKSNDGMPTDLFSCSKSGKCMSRSERTKGCDSFEAEKMAQEIDDSNSLSEDSDQIETFGEFQTQPALNIEPEIVAELLRSDDSIYDQLVNSQEQKNNSNCPKQNLNDANGAIKSEQFNESLKAEATLEEFNNEHDSQGSGSDLFSPSTASASKNHANEPDSSNSPVKLFSQEASEKFEFRLPESEDNDSNASSGSDELFR